MAFPIPSVNCTDCGFKKRGGNLKADEVINCPGKKGRKACGAPLIVGVTISRLPVMFREGEKRVLRLSKAALALPLIQEYPIKAYHGKEVVVLTDGPDDEGLVDVGLPFTFVPKKGPGITALPVLHGLLATG